MKFLSPIFLVLALLGLLTACSGGAVKEAQFDCVFPDSSKAKAPGWVCDEPVEGLALSAMGSAEKSAAGHDFMRQMAATSARSQLAQQMSAHVTSMIKQYVERTGIADSETVDKVGTVVTKQITNETLLGSRIMKTWVSPAGNIYVLVGMDKATVKANTKSAVKTSMDNEQALWQQFKAKMSQQELSEAIAGGL